MNLMVRHLIFCGHKAGVFGNETCMAGWLNIYCYGSKPDHYPGFSHGLVAQEMVGQQLIIMWMFPEMEVPLNHP